MPERVVGGALAGYAEVEGDAELPAWLRVDAGQVRQCFAVTVPVDTSVPRPALPLQLACVDAPEDEKLDDVLDYPTDFQGGCGLPAALSLGLSFRPPFPPCRRR